LILDSAADLGMYVRTICNQNTQIGGNAGCVDQNAGGQLEVLTVPVIANQTVFIIVDGFTNQQGVSASGPFSLSIESVEDPNAEQCTNNIDDNGNGAVDCADAGCDAACGEACTAPPVIGEGTTTGSTTGHATNRQGTCDSGVNGPGQADIGPDVAFAFTAPTAGTLTATVTTGFDAILYARADCGSQATETDCADQAGANGTETISFAVTANQTVFIFVDGFTNQQGVTGSGPFTLNVDLQ
jgi:hypothetical protein